MQTTYKGRAMTHDNHQHSTVYRDVFGAWRWEARDAAGEVIDSTQGFTGRDECVLDAAQAGFVTAGATARSILCAVPQRSHQLMQEAFGAHRLAFAENAYEALRNLHSRVFDGYVLDYWLPDLSGVSLCREIRKVDPSGPIVFCAASDREEARSRALHAGADAYLSRPTVEVMREQMDLLLNKAHAESLVAKKEEELAVDAELIRRAQAAAARAEHAQALTATATERVARLKAYKTFIESGGTRANFERWWPQVMTTAWANRELNGRNERG